MALTTTEEAQTRALIEQNAALLSLAASEPTIISKLAATKASLSDLPAATVKNNTDLFLVRQGTEDKSITGALAGGDAAYVSYTPAGVGAVETTVQKKLHERKSIDDFGASPANSAAANATAILAAIESGYPLKVPSGSYTCASLTSTRTGQIDMVGADSQELGRGTSFILFVDDGTTTGIGWDLDSFSSLVFKNLLFKPNVAVDGRVAVGNYIGIQSYSASASRTWHLENCRFEGFSTAGINTQSTIASELKTTSFYKCKAGVKSASGYFPVAGTTTRFVGGYSSLCTYVYDVGNMSQSYWENVIVEYSVRGVNTSGSIQNTVINCYAEGNTEYGGYFPNCSSMVFQNNYSNSAGDQWVSTGTTGSFGFDAIGATKVERNGVTSRQLVMYDRAGSESEHIKASNINYSGLTGIEDSAGTFLGIVPKRIAAQQSGQADRQDMFFVSGATAYGAPAGWTITNSATGVWDITWPSPLTGNTRWPFIFSQGVPAASNSVAGGQIDIITTIRARDSGSVWSGFQNMSVGFQLRIYTIDPATGAMTLSANGAVVSVNW